jgi:hypothetical protein
MSLLTTKDLAREMSLHPRTVKRWWKVLKVKPDACAGNGCHRWTPAAYARLLRKWRGYWAKRAFTPEEATAKWSGAVKAEREKRQLQFKFPPVVVATLRKVKQ